MQEEINDNKIRVELITLNRLRDYSRGKTQEVLESFTLFFNEDNEIQEKNDFPDSQRPVSLDQKIKDFFSFFSSKKEKGEKEEKRKKGKEEVVIEEKEEPIIVREEYKPKPTTGPGNENSYEEKMLTPAKKSKNKIIILFISLLLLVGGIVFVVFSEDDLSNVKNLINKFGFLSSEKPDKPVVVEKEEEEEIDDQTGVKEVPVDYSVLSTQKLIDEEKIMEINLFSQDLAKEEKGLLEKAKGIFGFNQNIEEDALSREKILKYLEQNSNLLVKDQIYFLNVYRGDSLLNLNELINIFGLKIKPDLKEKITASKFLVYLETKDAKISSQIRTGLLLIFEEGTITLDDLKEWEPTMIGDLKNIYLDNNLSLVNETTAFSNSTISERRRYINFSSNQLLSFDYAVAQDGLVIASSKQFGTAILKLLLENSREGRDPTRSLEN
jgi:hypothetical protein